MAELSHATVAAFVDDLVRAGVRHFSVCPGSRSTPLALAIAAHPGAKLWMHLDERSAAFFGLGLAKASRSPVALLCSSGTAAANFAPAVAEAFLAHVPLVVLTADRPQLLHDSGALQTIDQTRLYGSHVKWSVTLPEPDNSPEVSRYLRAVAGRAVGLARERPAGPVHLNCPFSEPLVPKDGWVAIPPDPGLAPRPSVELETAPRALAADQVERLLDELSGRRGVIVCGPQDDPGLIEPLLKLAEALGFPVLADPLSQVRGGAQDGQPIIDAYDAFLRHEPVAQELAPEVVLRFGAYPTSKPLQTYLERCLGARMLVVDGDDGWPEPSHRGAIFIHAGERNVCEAVLQAQGAAPTRSPSGWLEQWQTINRRTRSAIEEHLAKQDELFEGQVFAELARLLPDQAAIYVGNSMPIRDLDTFFPASERTVRFFGNRGASGIDGVVSSALGAAAAGGNRVVLVIGDVSFYHDSNGLLAARRYGLDLTVVLLNNDGGGIFSFLPQATAMNGVTFELLFGTPHGLDFAPIVQAYGGRHQLIRSWPEFRSAFGAAGDRGGLTVIEVPTERRRNVTAHEAVWEAVVACLQAPQLAGEVV
ncbi:MAG: 2-succinyl-5-enolpyruvyl-6-hydroxy-3-cyclohexene-1-carboxylic-acid synthase [Chloroflexi bacterium]|nr:2-succinyl-5-enolpyruvyl-6-hydroxy-3-cyclohexene-1-carboxylic-acid synthase [Chloroflexota bacterium]